MTTYVYEGRRVEIPRVADVSAQMMPDGLYGALVQATLNGVDPWEREQSPIETVEFGGEFIKPMAVPIAGQEVRWGVHLYHKAAQPQPSPFVEQFDMEAVPTNLLTIELCGTPEKPVLVRAYGGDYIPPLPWMASAKKADGGLKACWDFWRARAYYSPGFKLIKRKTHATALPEWFTA